jgi:hypothetical protein
MGLMDAKEYDPRPARRRKRLAVIAALMVALATIAWLWLRHWPETRIVDRFFQAIEARNFEQAYALYTGDANWQQHPAKHHDYTFDQFRRDWGPSGDYGAITTHHIECATEPPGRASSAASGVIVVVAINQISQRKSLWVEKSARSITVSPLECTSDCRQCQY